MFAVRVLLYAGSHDVIEDASARPPHPRMVGPADGVAQSVLGVYAWFLAKSSCIF